MAGSTVLQGGNNPERRPEWGPALAAAINECLHVNAENVSAFEYTATLLQTLDKKLGSKTLELSDAFLRKITIGHWGDFVFPPFPSGCPIEGNFAQYLIDHLSGTQTPVPLNDPRSVIAAVVIFFAPHLTAEQKRLQIKLTARDNLRASITAMLTQTDPTLNATIGAGLVRGLLFNVICAHTLSTGLPQQYGGVLPVLSALIEYQAGMLAAGFTNLQNRRKGLKDHPCAFIPPMLKLLEHHPIGTATLFDEITRIEGHWRHFGTGLAAETPGELLDNELCASIREPKPPADQPVSADSSESQLRFPDLPYAETPKTVEAEWRAALGELPYTLRQQIIGWPDLFRYLTNKRSWKYPVTVAHDLASHNVVEFSIGGVDPSNIPSCFDDKNLAELASRVLGSYPKIVPSSVLKLNTADGRDLKELLALLPIFMTEPVLPDPVAREIPVCSASLGREDRRVGSERFFSVLGFLKGLYSGRQPPSLVADHDLPYFLKNIAESGFLFRPESPNTTDRPSKVIVERDDLADPSEILRMLREIWSEDQTIEQKISRKLALRIFTEIIAPRLAQTQTGDVLQPFSTGSRLVGWKEHSVLKRFDGLNLLRPEDVPAPPEAGQDTRTTLYVLEIPPSGSRPTTSPVNSESLVHT